MSDFKPRSEVTCPHCKRQTDRFPIEVERFNWLGFLFFGLWALLFSERKSALLCRHCKETFTTKEFRGSRGDRIIGRVLFWICFLILCAVLSLLFGQPD